MPIEQLLHFSTASRFPSPPQQNDHTRKATKKKKKLAIRDQTTTAVAKTGEPVLPQNDANGPRIQTQKLRHPELPVDGNTGGGGVHHEHTKRGSRDNKPPKIAHQQPADERVHAKPNGIDPGRAPITQTEKTGTEGGATERTRANATGDNTTIAQNGTDSERPPSAPPAKITNKQRRGRTRGNQGAVTNGIPNEAMERHRSNTARTRRHQPRDHQNLTRVILAGTTAIRITSAGKRRPRKEVKRSPEHTRDADKASTHGQQKKRPGGKRGEGKGEDGTDSAQRKQCPRNDPADEDHQKPKIPTGQTGEPTTESSRQKKKTNRQPTKKKTTKRTHTIFRQNTKTEVDRGLHQANRRTRRP